VSDERLREAERRWKESGSVVDEARYLQERVRVGNLTKERLELAAYCGHEGASRLCTTVNPPADLKEWLFGLTRFSIPTSTLQRASAACALRVLATMSPADKSHPHWHLCESALTAWATAPGPETAERFDKVLIQANGAFLGDSDVCQVAFSVVGSVLLIPLHSIGSSRALIGAGGAKSLACSVLLEHAGVTSNRSHFTEPGESEPR